MSYPIEKLENQMIDLIDEIYANSGLGRWFGKGGVGSSSGGGWDRYDSSGKKAGKCGDAKKGSSYSACLGKKYAARLRSKGGFWVGMSVASALGGVITFVADRLFIKG